MKWEYKTVKLSISDYDYGDRTVEKVFADIEDSLNEAGMDGWELVSTLDNDKKGYIRLIIALFKRPMKNPQLDEEKHVVPARNVTKPRTTHQASQYNM
jgi:hypothetical protein